MRNYLYISDAKVDMYLAQFEPAEKEEVALRLGLNLGIVQGTVERRSTPLEDRVQRLEAVEAKVRDIHEVGLITDDTPWIDDAVTATPASFGGRSEEVLFFLSSTPTYFFGLAGSKHHVIGNVRTEEATSSVSHHHALVENLGRIDSRNLAHVITGSEETITDTVHFGVSTAPGSSTWPRILGEAMADHPQNLPATPIDFLARRLTSDIYDRAERRYILASPLYIAVEDVI